MTVSKRRFLFDRMLGKLSKKMRMLGYDSVLNPEGEEGRFLLNAARSGRTAVTRARALGDRPGPPPVILRSQDVHDQIVELFAALGERPSFDPFTRCIECNEALVGESPENVLGMVPTKVRNIFDEYHRCPGCGRIYWKGTHWQAMADEVKRIEERFEKV